MTTIWKRSTLGGSVNEWQPNYGPSQGLVRRVYRAIYDARPPEPKTVTLGRRTFIFVKECWVHSDGTRESYPSNIWLALARIWELEHPDEEADR